MNFAWAPQPGPQTEAITADWCNELCYGGAAGGGKSDFLLGDFLQDVPTYGSAWQGILFRRTYPELEELVRRAYDLYPQTGAAWLEQKHSWIWPNGAILRMRYLERDADASRYQGHQYTWEGWDELTQWPSDYSYRYLRGRLRSASPVSTMRIRAATNPGGPGHHWVKAYFIDPEPNGFKTITDDVTGMTRMFVPARLQDNIILLSADPGYGDRLKGLGSPQLVKAWLEGDWNVIEGSFFPEFGARHVIAPFALPEHWYRFRSGDWGSARPFSVGWWGVASDDYSIEADSGANHGRVESVGRDCRIVPRGALVRYREWYGASAPNVGLKLTAEQVADGIKEREKGDPAGIQGVMDPAAFSSDGGPSIAERMGSRGIYWRRADNARVARNGAMGGWDQLRARLIGESGRPMLYVFSTCRDLIRTLPALQHDRDRPEDVDSNTEDHAPDECVAANTLISTDRGDLPITRITVGMKVGTSGGFKPIKAVFFTGEKPVFRVLMSNGNALIATANHPVFVEGHGYRSVADLRYGDILRTCARRSNFAVRLMRASRTIRTGIGAFISGTIGTRYIAQFGVIIMARFRKGLSSITSTAIRSTMSLKILPPWKLASIQSIIGPKQFRSYVSVANAGGYIISSSRATRINSVPMPANQRGGGRQNSTTKRGNALLAVPNSIVAAFQSRNFVAMHVASPALTSGRRALSLVGNAVQNLWLKIGGRHSARTHVVSVTPAGLRQVFNLSVAGEEEYFANGILVHNCRYACLSRPYIREKEQSLPKIDDRYRPANSYDRADDVLTI